MIVVTFKKKCEIMFFNWHIFLLINLQIHKGVSIQPAKVIDFGKKIDLRIFENEKKKIASKINIGS